MIKLYKCEVFCADALSSGVISAVATCASAIHGSRWPFASALQHEVAGVRGNVDLDDRQFRLLCVLFHDTPGC
jgi:hypothetical protein